ncbi:hypothetical protein ABIB17_002271 [Arthrobacter sp. UYEF6]
MSLAPLQDPSVAPGPAAAKAHGSGEGTASLVFSLVAPASIFLTGPLSRVAVLYSGPSDGAGRLDVSAPWVLWSYPVIFTLLAVTLGVVSLRVFARRSTGWRAGVAALWILAAEVAVGLLLVLRNGDFMILP